LNWILRIGAPWKDLPQRYPLYQTCHQRFQEWSKQGTFQSILHELAEGLHECGKGTKIMAIVDASGIPFAAHVKSTSPP